MKKEVYIKNEKLQKKLNNLLSDYQIYYQNLRAFHWLVKGPNFYHLHSKFEEFYTQVNEEIDEVAERILMLGGTPLHRFEDYLAQASLKAEQNLSRSSEIIPVVIQNSEFLLASFREIADLAGETEDEGSTGLMSELISTYEKQLWMLNSLKE